MSNYSKLYWLTRLDNILGVFMFLVIASGIILIIYHIIKMVDCYDKEEKKEFDVNYGIIRKIALFILPIGLVIIMFMPSKNDMIIIYAGGKTMDYVQSDTSLSKIPYQTTAIITQYLDKSLKEIKETK